MEARFLKAELIVHVLETGRHALVSDSDVAWMRDPFAHWDRTFELQGLSDIRSMNVTTQRHHERQVIWVEEPFLGGRLGGRFGAGSGPGWEQGIGRCGSRWGIGGSGSGAYGRYGVGMGWVWGGYQADTERDERWGWRLSVAGWGAPPRQLRE